MKFQPTKCKVLFLGHQQEHEIPNLYLYSKKEDASLEKVQVEQTEVEKGIGVYVDQKLNFQEHIINKTVRQILQWELLGGLLATLATKR